MQRPELTFPTPVARLVRKLYTKANVILEYGSGGSTILGAEMPNKTLFSVESDRVWANNMQSYINTLDTSSDVFVEWVDIGSTGVWGKPSDSSKWQDYCNYPLSIWSHEKFVNPDVVLVDGRFRTACFLTSVFMTKKPITILFDDYKNRDRYHVVEDVIKPSYFVDRMAVFEVTPMFLSRENFASVITEFFNVSMDPRYFTNLIREKKKKSKQETLAKWPDDAHDFCNNISKKKSIIKFITKVKDDPKFLNSWIEHHSKIAGLENLIVIDNMSTNSEIYNIYEQFKGKIHIIQYDGFHNDVHRVHKFQQLYDALRLSTHYYQFLDVDEYLTYVDNSLTHDSSRVKEILSKCDYPVIPGIWLENEPGFSQRFSLQQKNSIAKISIRTGKPILHSNTKVRGLINHNFQVESFLYGNIITNFFVLHMKWLSSEQRILSNLEKLKAYNVLSENAGIDDALQINPETLGVGNPRAWLREIRKLKLANSRSCIKKDKANDSIEFLPSGDILFENSWQKESLKELLNYPMKYKSKIFE